MAEAANAFAFERTFNRRDLDDFLKQKNVSCRNTKRQANGIVKIYHCRNFRRNDCKFRVRCEHSQLSEAVDVYVSGTHEHSLDKSDFYFSADVVNIVEQGVKHDRTPTMIAEDIKKSGHPCPDSTQLSNMVHRARRKVKCTGPTDSYQLTQWCTDRQLTPTSDLHDVFVPIFDVRPERLHIAITTRHLMSNATKCPLFQVDATFKLNWHDYPCILTGTQDFARTFYPTMFHIVWKDEDTNVYTSVFQSYLDTLAQLGLPANLPQYLLADGHGGITAAAEQVFPGSMRLMCWFHMKKAVKNSEALKGTPEAIREPIYRALDDLQLAPTHEVFRSAAELLVREWETQGLARFAAYFRSTWLEGPLKYWYEAAVRNLPANNNGVESKNGGMKSQWTQRVRETMAVFLPRIEQMVKKYSVDSFTGGFKFPPPIPIPLYDSAWKWTQADPSTRTIIPLANPHYPQYAVRVSRQTMDFDSYYHLFCTPSLFSDFSQYRKWLHEWHLVEGFPGGFLTCNCRTGLKEYRCRHSVGVEMLHHGLAVPPQVSALPIAAYRKRGRPKKVGPALSKE